jgi:hypothetical protein
MSSFKSLMRAALLLLVVGAASSTAAYACYCESSRDLSFCYGSACYANFDGSCTCY